MRRVTIEALADFLQRYRWPLLVLALVLVTAAALAVPRVRLDFSIGPLLQAEQESMRELEEFQRAVPPQHYPFVVTVSWPEPIGWAEVDALAQLHEQLESWPRIDKALSLANVELVEPVAGVLRSSRFGAARGSESVATRVGRHPLLRGRLISRDGRSAALLLTPARAGSRADRVFDLENLSAFARAAAPPGTQLRLLGSQLVDRRIRQLIRRDMFQGILLEAALALVLMALLFRSLRGALLPLLVIFVAVTLYLGLTVALGWRISILEVAVPGLIMIIGLSDGVHMMHRFEEAFARTGNRSAAILEMLRRVGFACLLTSLTTALGFLSLLIADHALIRDFAISASAGVLVAFVTMIVLLPLALSFWPVRRVRRGKLGRDLNLRYGRPRLTLAVFAVLLGFTAVGLGRVEIDSRWLEELPADEPVVADLRWMEQNFNGPLAIVVRARGPLDSVQAFHALEQLQARVLAEPGVTGVESYTDWVREALGQPARVEEGALTAVMQALRLGSDIFPAHFLSAGLDEARVLFRTTDVGTRRFLELRDLIQDQARAMPAGLSTEVVGYNRVAHESTRLVVTTMLRSIAITLGVISLLIAVLYRSWRIGLASVLPNFLPIVFAIGLTGWLETPLRVGIVMIFSVGIGLAVDDTIHILTRFVQERRRFPYGDVHESLAASVRSTGRALVATSVILVLGGFCYLPSAFQSLRDVGILLSAIVAMAVLADLFLLPLALERLLAGKRAPPSSAAGSRPPPPPGG